MRWAESNGNDFEIGINKKTMIFSIIVFLFEKSGAAGNRTLVQTYSS